MTEKEFWTYFYGTTAKRKKQFEGEYEVPLEKIVKMGKLLTLKKVTIKAKEVILMSLAHHSSRTALNALRAYNKYPDKELRIFAELALDECEMWNE